MSLLKTLKGQILVVSAACMVAALLALTLVNYFSARAQARVALAEEGQATAKSHAEAIEEWTRAKAGIIAASIAAFEEPEPAKSLPASSRGCWRRSGTPAARCVWPPKRSPPAITT